MTNLPNGWEVPELDGRGNGPYGLLHIMRYGVVRSFLDACDAPDAAQGAALERVLDAARGTRFGRASGLERVKSIAEFRRALPVSCYEDMARDVAAMAAGEQGVRTRHPVRAFVKTSGTTDAPKLLPVTAPWARTVGDAQTIWVMGMVKEQEELVHGRALTSVGAAVESYTAGGIPIGSNTGRMYLAQSWLVRRRYAVPYEVFTLDEPELRHYCLLRLALSEPNIRSWTTANPSTILALCRSLARWREELTADVRDGTLQRGPGVRLAPSLRARWKRYCKPRALPEDWTPAALWDLRAIHCWKGGYAPFYLARLPAALGADLPVREVGISASEGYFGVPLHSSWSGGVAWCGGHLLELMPEGGGPCIGVHEAEAGRSYRLVLTTTTGLYRYDMNDVVEVVGHYRRAPVLRFLRKGRDVLSVTGEKVTADQIERAVRDTLPSSVEAFAVGVRLAEVAVYVLCVEGDVDPECARHFDRRLRSGNVEYEAKRASGRLARAVVAQVPEGTFGRWRSERLRAGAADGQVKDPVVLHGADLDRMCAGWR